MTAVADRVCAWVADHPGRTAEDIARSVRVRRRTVETVLASPLFSAAHGAGQSIVYTLTGDGVPARPVPSETPAKETDCEFLLRVLSDGRAHNLNDILRRSFLERDCGLTVHSRAADLRKRGHSIFNWKDGERGAGSWYRLLPDVPVVAAAPAADEASVRPAAALGDQLRIDVAA